MKCFLDDNEAVDSVEFDSGNNAEIRVSVDLCQAHSDELDKDEFEFESKYGKEILEKAYEREGWI